MVTRRIIVLQEAKGFIVIVSVRKWLLGAHDCDTRENASFDSPKVM